MKRRTDGNAEEASTTPGAKKRKVEAKDEKPTCFEDLPPEMAAHIVSLIRQSDLSACCRSSPLFSPGKNERLALALGCSCLCEAIALYYRRKNGEDDGDEARFHAHLPPFVEGGKVDHRFIGHDVSCISTALGYAVRRNDLGLATLLHARAAYLWHGDNSYSPKGPHRTERGLSFRDLLWNQPQPDAAPAPVEAALAGGHIEMLRWLVGSTEALPPDMAAELEASDLLAQDGRVATNALARLYDAHHEAFAARILTALEREQPSEVSRCISLMLALKKERADQLIAYVAARCGCHADKGPRLFAWAKAIFAQARIDAARDPPTPSDPPPAGVVTGSDGGAPYVFDDATVTKLMRAGDRAARSDFVEGRTEDVQSGLASRRSPSVSSGSRGGQIADPTSTEDFATMLDRGEDCAAIAFKWLDENRPETCTALARSWLERLVKTCPSARQLGRLLCVVPRYLWPYCSVRVMPALAQRAPVALLRTLAAQSTVPFHSECFQRAVMTGGRVELLDWYFDEWAHCSRTITEADATTAQQMGHSAAACWLLARVSRNH